LNPRISAPTAARLFGVEIPIYTNRLRMYARAPAARSAFLSGFSAAITSRSKRSTFGFAAFGIGRTQSEV
jgi:hypothetical protein